MEFGPAGFRPHEEPVRKRIVAALSPAASRLLPVVARPSPRRRDGTAVTLPEPAAGPIPALPVTPAPE